MLDIVRNSQTHNGNHAGNGAVNGRGLARRQLSAAGRVRLAADIATKRRQFDPSLTQIASATGVSTSQLRAELKARAWLEAQRLAAERRLQTQLEAEAVNTQADTIVTAWTSASSEARAVAVRLLGTEHVWDTLTESVV